MTETVFDQITDTPTTTPEASQLDSLVGEGKKFSTAEELAKGKQESDMFIEHLKAELAEVKGELNNRLSAQAALDAIKEERNSQNPETGTSATLDPSQISGLVRDELVAARTEELQSRNLAEADAFLTEKLGSKEAVEVAVKKKASEMGVSVGFMIDATKRSPQALYNLLGINEQGTKQTATPTQVAGTVNTAALQGTSGSLEVGTEAYYENMRKTDPAKYFHSSTQNAIFAARKAGTYKPT